MGIVAEPAYPMEFGRQVNRCAKVLSYYTHALLAFFQDLLLKELATSVCSMYIIIMY